MEGEDRREFRRYCLLAKKVADEGFISKIKGHLDSENPVAARHAKWMLDVISV